MTGKLARPGVSLPSVISDATLLARRLDRLRTERPSRPAEGGFAERADADLHRVREDEPDAYSGARRERDGARAERAHRLARDLGGTVLDSEEGPAVWGPETSVLLPLTADQLATLPYPIDPARPIVCLDTETTGLGTGAGTVIFLVGLGHWEGDRYRVRQLILPDQPDERAFLAALAAAIPADAWLVTYNGRSFDWPLIVTRYRLSGRSAPRHAGHLDLLPVARQLWKHRLPDARLASVEAGICGVRRQGDLSGALIPARYLGYLRTGRGGLLREVADHNRQDVLSLAFLLTELTERLATPQGRRQADPGDLCGLARAYARRGRLTEALECHEMALIRLGEGPAWGPEADRVDGVSAERARLLARLGRRREAAGAWGRIAARDGPLAATAWLKLARHHEHAERSPTAALSAAMRAASIAERARGLGRPMIAVEADLERRLPRLRRRLARQSRQAGQAARPARAAPSQAGEWLVSPA